MLEVLRENYGQFLLCKVSNIRSHSHATTNQHLYCSKEGKRDAKEDKGKSMIDACTVATVDGKKGTPWDEATSYGEK